MIDTLKIVSRKSPLAMWQTHNIADKIRAKHPGLTIDIVTMDTTGDRIRDRPLPEIGAKGLFTKELEEALLEGRADLAVHSLKDLPSELPDGLIWSGSTTRADATDALIAPQATSLSELKEGATVATGSVRRRAQIRSQRPDIRFQELRGNIDTRLQKLNENGWDAIVMASAALDRMGRSELISERLDPTVFVPAVSQGAIGIETAERRDDVHELLAPIFCESTTTACAAERLFMNGLQGGCSVSLGAHAAQTDQGWQFHGWVSNVAGTEFLRDASNGDNPIELAQNMLDSFVAQGAKAMMGRG